MSEDGFLMFGLLALLDDVIEKRRPFGGHMEAVAVRRGMLDSLRETIEEMEIEDEQLAGMRKIVFACL